MEHSFDNLIQRKEKNNPHFKQKMAVGTKLVEIGMKIQHYRYQHHLTQRQLARMAHMPQSSIARIENGDNVNMKSLFKIAHAMHQNMIIKITA